MKSYLNISLLAATMIAGSAFAAELEVHRNMHFYPQNMMQASSAPALSRAQVVSQIPATGASMVSETAYPLDVQVPSNASGLTREQVKAELAAAQANGTFMIGTINYPVSD